MKLDIGTQVMLMTIPGNQTKYFGIEVGTIGTIIQSYHGKAVKFPSRNVYIAEKHLRVISVSFNKNAMHLLKR